MNNPRVFMFSGQGSHYYHMASELYQCDPIFKYWMNHQDSIVSDYLGESVLDVIYSDKHKKEHIFDRMLHTHPAIFMVEYALAKTLMHRGLDPDYLLGASLGEFVSIVLAGAESLEKMLATLIKHAKSCEDRCPPGEMIAIFDDYTKFKSTPVLYNNSEIASINFASHYVVAGSSEKLNRIVEYLQQCDITYQKIAVSFAFHSSDFDSLRDVFSDAMGTRKLDIPIISSALTDIIYSVDDEHYWRVARDPISFYQTLLKFNENGPADYIDLGPSGTMATFTRNALKSSTSRIYSILTPFGNDSAGLSSILDTLVGSEIV